MEFSSNQFVSDVNFTFTVFTIPYNMGTLLAQKVDEAENSLVVELSKNPQTQNTTKETNHTDSVETKVRQQKEQLYPIS